MDPSKANPNSVVAKSANPLDDTAISSPRIQSGRPEAELLALPEEVIHEVAVRMLQRSTMLIGEFMKAQPGVSNAGALTETERLTLEIGSHRRQPEIRPRMCARICDLVEILAQRCIDIGLPENLVGDALLYELQWRREMPGHCLGLGSMWPSGRPDRLLRPIKEVAGIALSVEIDSAEEITKSLTGLIAGVDMELSEATLTRLQKSEVSTVTELLKKVAELYYTFGGMGKISISQCECFGGDTSESKLNFACLQTEHGSEGENPTKWQYGVPDSYGVFYAIANFIMRDLSPVNMKIQAFPYRQDVTEKLAPLAPFVLTPEQKISFLHFAAEAVRNIYQSSYESVRPMLPLLLAGTPNSRKYWIDTVTACDGPSYGEFLCRTLGVDLTPTGVDATGLEQGMFATFRSSTLSKVIYDRVTAPGYPADETLEVSISGLPFRS